jgi:gamma-glutamyltranspeptidase/glutathione hydrolase
MAACLSLTSVALADPAGSARFARGANGMVATSTPAATAAGVQILEKGGNAVDAGVAAAFALMVSDPPMTSLGGRGHILIALSDGTVAGYDGATQAPAGVPPLAGDEDLREGYAVVPVPGNPAALAAALREHGTMELADVLRPAIGLAEEGFEVSPTQAGLWARREERLRRHPGTAKLFLKEDGTPYRAGETFRQPALARTLRQLTQNGVDAFYRGAVAEKIARDIGRNLGFVRKRDLEAYRPLPGVIVRTSYGGHEVITLGGRAWGDTLVEMLNILEQFDVGPGEATPEELEILARAMAQALDDRPQEIGSLKPKKDGYALSVLSSAEFARERAEMIRRRLRPDDSERQGELHDTTHLSVMDRDGNAVALTMSIGPAFGSGAAGPELGFLFAHSYRMRADPAPDARDETEMTPTIVLRQGKPFLVLGAAGSERIPTAVVQVISSVIDRGHSLEQAMRAPRLFCLGGNLRMQEGFPPAVVTALQARGFEVEIHEPGTPGHLGRVHAVLYEPAKGTFFGAADLQYDGAAAGPGDIQE